MPQANIKQVDFPVVLTYSGSLAGSGSIGGVSFSTDGYSKLVGYVKMSSSTVAGSGLRIAQSMDGANWDINQDAALAAGASAASAVNLVAPFVMVHIHNGATANACVRTIWRLQSV